MIRPLILSSFWLAFSFNSQLVLSCSAAINPDINNDGNVDITDYLLIARSFGLRPGDPRYNRKADTNCDQKIDQQDIDFVSRSFHKQYAIKPEVTVSLHQPQRLQMTIQQMQPLNIYVGLFLSNSIPFTALIEQSLQPEEGLKLKPLLNETLNIKKSYSHYYKTSIKALKKGKYTLTTSLTVLESGQTVIKKTQIEVTEKFVISLHQPLKLQMNTHQMRSLNFDLFLSSPNSIPFTARIKQSLQPEKGLELSPLLNKTLSIKVFYTDDFNVSIKALKKGEYTLITEITILENGHKLIKKTQIKVTDIEDVLKNNNAFDYSQKQIDIGFMIDQSHLTSLPNASTTATVYLNMINEPGDIKSLAIVDKKSNRQWLLQQQELGLFSGKVIFKNASYGQCFDLYAQVITTNHQVIKSLMQQTICMRDQFGRPVLPTFKSKTHDAKYKSSPVDTLLKHKSNFQ